MSTAVQLLTPKTDFDGIHPATDLGNAKKFIEDHGQIARYCAAKGKWLIWSGDRWRWDDTDKIVSMAEDTVRRMLLDAIPDLSNCQNSASHAIKSMARSRIDALLYLARPHLAVRMEELDTDPLAFNVANGTLNLTTGVLEPHDPSRMITKLSPVIYDPQAPCPTWLKFLADITSGDQELQSYLQRAVGYSLTGSTVEHVLFILYGSGCNGKTTFVETIRHVFGDYAKASDFSTFMQSKPSGPRNDLAMLCGARFVTAAESEDGKQLAESFVKQVTGGDRVTARFLYGEHFEFTPTFKLWLSTNHKPAIHGTEDGIWRRIRLIPLVVRIADDKIDHQLPDKLKDEASGILNWALEGLKQYREHGLGEPVCVRNATSAYRHEEDALGRFIATRCFLQASAREQARRLYDAFRRWAAQSGEIMVTEKKFAHALAERGLNATRTTFGKIWEGISLQPDRVHVA